jgi:hypothetical protein
LRRVASRCVQMQATGTGWSIVRFSIGFIGILTPQPALQSMRNFFNRYYLIKPPDLMLIEWMHGDWPGGMRAPTLDGGLRASPPPPPPPPPPPHAHTLALTRIDMHTHETSTQRAHTIEHIGDTAQAKQQRE